MRRPMSKLKQPGMTEADAEAYLTANRPRTDLALLQIFELHREGYVTLEEAKILMQKHTGAASHFDLWRKLHRNLRPA